MTDTQADIALWAPVEQYIRDLKWSADTSDNERTLVAGNIRGFYGWLIGGMNKPSRVVELDGQLDADEWSWERRYNRMFDLALELERELAALKWESFG